MVADTPGTMSFTLSIGVSKCLSACSIHLSNALLECVKTGRMAMFMARAVHIAWIRLMHPGVIRCFVVNNPMQMMVMVTLSANGMNFERRSFLYLISWCCLFIKGYIVTVH